MAESVSDYHKSVDLDEYTDVVIGSYQQAVNRVTKQLPGIDKIKKAYYDGMYYYQDLYKRAVVYGSSPMDVPNADDLCIIFDYALVKSGTHYFVSLKFVRPNNIIGNIVITVDKLCERERGLFYELTDTLTRPWKWRGKHEY